MAVKCTSCSQEIDELAVFPGGICVECYAKTPEANQPSSADGISQMWGKACLNKARVS